MDELRDAYLKRMLKTWSAAKKAPVGTRAQLLHRAAELIYLDASEWSYGFAMHNYRSYKWDLVYLAWRPIHSIETSLASSIMIL